MRHAPLRAITLPVIGEETMARAGIDLEFCRFSCRFQSFLHCLYLIGRNARVLGAVKAEHWRTDLGCVGERHQERTKCVGRLSIRV
jgi:hypothetical protein